MPETMTQLAELFEKEISIFSATLTKTPAELYDPIKYILSLGGKRLRPLLVLNSCKFYNGNIEQAIPIAMAVELFHNFSLIHDDIMDNAPLRRGKDAVHKKWNTNTAILSGDAALVIAYESISNSSLSDSVKVQLMKTFSGMALKVCEGQQVDMNFEGRSNISITQYIKMIEAKTAELIGASLKMGAMVAGANESECEKIYRAGIDIGIAFQLQDDILDVYADGKFGKQKGGDIAANKKTWLLLKALELSKTNHYKHEELLQWQQTANYSAEKIESVTAIYDFLNIRNLAEAEMQKYFQSSIKKMNELQADKKAITGFTEYLGLLAVREA